MCFLVMFHSNKEIVTHNKGKQNTDTNTTFISFYHTCYGSSALENALNEPPSNNNKVYII